MVKTNQINQVGSKKENQLEKVRLGLPIFKRTLFRVLGSVTFIVMTSIFTFAFLLIVILGNFVMMPESFGATGSVLLTWVPFIIMAMYVMYFELHQISVVYNKEIKDGIINLEIRSGYSKTRIFAERLLANKVIIWSWILVMILLYATIGGLNSNLMPHQIAMNRVGSLSLIIIFDLFMTAILMLFASTSSSVFMGVLATLISLMYMAAPGISLAYAPDKYRETGTFESEDKVSKYEFMYRLQEIEEKYSEGDNESIITKNKESLKNLNSIFDSSMNMDEQTRYYTEYQRLNPDNNTNNGDESVTLEEYILVLMANGLLTEVENLNLYTSLTSSDKPVDLAINKTFFNENEYLKTISKIKDIDKDNNSRITKNEMENSMFRGYEMGNNIEPKRSQDLYKGKNGFFNLVDKLYKNVKSPEAKEIIALVEEAALYLYDNNYWIDSFYTSSREDQGLNYLDWTFDAPGKYGDDSWESNQYIWKYIVTNNPSYDKNNDWANEIEISDGARTFIKIYTDLIKNYASMDYRPAYGTEYPSNSSSKERKIDAIEHNNNFKLVAWLDPLTGFTRSFFEIGNSAYASAENISHYSSIVYDVVSITSNEILEFDEISRNAETKDRYHRRTLDGLFGDTNDTKVVKLESNFNPQLYIVLFLLVDIAILGLGFWIFYKRIII